MELGDNSKVAYLCSGTFSEGAQHCFLCSLVRTGLFCCIVLVFLALSGLTLRNLSDFLFRRLVGLVSYLAQELKV